PPPPFPYTTLFRSSAPAMLQMKEPPSSRSPRSELASPAEPVNDRFGRNERCPAVSLKPAACNDSSAAAMSGLRKSISEGIPVEGGGGTSGSVSAVAIEPAG